MATVTHTNDPSADPADAAGTPAPEPESRRPGAGQTAGNVARGALIGLAETVPGVSGGTVALITGIYSRLIASGKLITDIPKAAVTRGDWRQTVRRIDWWLLLPVGIGMVLAVVSIAGAMETFVTEQPVYAYALFMGMIAVSVVIPFLEIPPGALQSGAARAKAAGIFVLFAAATLALTSLPRSEITDPPLVLVFFAAAVAVCALVLPGVSGSFFLLVVGLYTPTLAAVDDRNLTYLAVFALGALVGIVSFVRGLEWILENHHTYAMVAAAGLLLGSLRALWPWQTDDGALEPVGSDWPAALGLFLLGALVVGVVALIQRRLYTADALTSEQARADN